MMQRWKVMREVSRITQQLSALLEAPFRKARTRHHDKSRHSNNRVTFGSCEVSNRISLILLFQPKGVAKSTFQQIDWLQSRGYSTLVVSNAALNDADRLQLVSQCWRVVERPNFGYDFGGYREGIMQLWDENISPEHLVVLNDSTWFPLDADSQILETAESMASDIVGAIKRAKGSIQWLESYFFYIPRKTFLSYAFVDFWKEYKLTSNKYSVIRQGERDFGVALQRGGLALSEIYSVESFMDGVRAASPQTLRKTLTYSSQDLDERNGVCAKLLEECEQSESWRLSAVDYIKSSLNNLMFNSHYPYGSVHFLNFPFLKKSSEKINAKWREGYLAAVKAGDITPPQEQIMYEIQSKIAQGSTH